MEWLVFQQVKCLQDFGNVVKVEDLIKECISRTKKILDEKNELTEEEKEVVAKKVGVGALIFSNLSTTLIKDSVFVWDNVLDFTGDTAPYIQYVNVRINSILKNVEETYNDLVKSYVFILYRNVAISLVIYILDPFDFSTSANPAPSSSKSITFAPSETCVIPFSSSILITSFI